MVIENQITKTETVYELKDKYKVPSFEEFMENYKVDGKLNDNYELEVDSYGDISVEKGYGPVKDPEVRTWCQKHNEEQRKLKEKWSSGSSSSKSSSSNTGKTLAVATATAISTAALGPIGTICVGTAAILVGDSLSQNNHSQADDEIGNSICEAGFEFITGGAIDGMVSKVFKK